MALNEKCYIDFPFMISGCVANYFSSGEAVTLSEEEFDKKLMGYKCVLSSKATEDSMVYHICSFVPTVIYLLFKIRIMLVV